MKKPLPINQKYYYFNEITVLEYTSNTYMVYA